MARLLALVTLVAGAFATMHESSFPISVPEVGGISGGGGQGVNVVSNSLQGGSSSVSVGVVIIASSNGGGSSVKNWNKPMMEAGMTHQVSTDDTTYLIFPWLSSDTCCRSPLAVMLDSSTLLTLSMLPLAT